MSLNKKPNPPLDVIPEDSGPSTNTNEPTKHPDRLDVDDAQIEEPKDGLFKKAPQKEEPTKKRKKTGNPEFD